MCLVTNPNVHNGMFLMSSLGYILGLAGMAYYPQYLLKCTPNATPLFILRSGLDWLPVFWLVSPSGASPLYKSERERVDAKFLVCIEVHSNGVNKITITKNSSN